MRPALRHFTSAITALLLACSGCNLLGPSEPPGVPLAVQLIDRGDGFLTLSWLAPEGSVEVDGYVVDWSPDPVGVGAVIVLTETRTASISRLNNGTLYDVYVRARNAAGVGPPSPLVQGRPARIPEAPQSVVVTPGDGQLRVRWVIPPDDGGEPVVTYRLRLTPGQGVVEVPATEEPTVLLSELVNGTPYSVSVTALNVMGEGAGSEPVSATPASVPSEPRSVIAQRGDREVQVQWEAPEEEGGAAVTHYEVRATGHPPVWADALARQAVVTGLDNGTEYSLEVVAFNAAGEGPPSPWILATPATLPGAPSSLSAIPHDRSIALSWIPPEDEGGVPVLEYEVSGAGTDPLRVTTPEVTVSGLRNGAQVSLSVRARNEVGWGEPVSLPVTPHAEPAILSVGAPAAAVACVQIPYVASRPVDALVDVVVEFDDGSGFRRATQAPSRDVPGTLRRPAAPEGRAHAFLWDAFADLGRRTAEVKVRITPSGAEEPAATGPAVESALFTVNNLAQLGPGLPVQGAQPVTRVHAADFNRDGWPDLAWLSGAGEVFVQLALQDGTFGIAAAVPGEGVLDFVPGDFNRDAREDLALLTGENQLQLLQGEAGTGFVVGATLALAAGHERLLAGDLDLDGWLDLVAIASAGGTSSAVLRPKAGASVLTSTLGTSADESLLADVDLDGRQDLVFLAASRGELAVARGRGDGTFESPATSALPSAGARLLLAPVPRSRRAEALVVTAGGLLALPGVDAVSFGAATELWSQPVDDLQLADFDLDGTSDLLLSRAGERILVSRRPTGLEEVARFTLGAPFPASLLVDLDRDADLDLVAAGSSGLTQWENRSPRPCGARFEGPLLLHSAGTYEGAPSQPEDSLAVGDFDGDGKLDVAGIVHRFYGGEYWEYGTGRSFRMWWGLGDGTFWTPPLRYTAGYEVQRYATLAAVDVDGDGREEVFAGTLNGVVRVEMLADGYVDEGHPRSDAIPEPQCLFAGDLDQDGTKDLIVGHADGQVRTLFMRDAGFQEGPVSTLPTTVCRGEVGEVTGDGIPDLVFGSVPEVARGTLQGDFLPPVPLLGTSMGCVWPSLQDLNADGLEDLICGGAAGARSFLQEEGGLFGAERLLASFTGVRRVRVAGTPTRQIVFGRSHHDDQSAEVPSNGMASSIRSYAHVWGGERDALTSADFDADGQEDILAASTAQFDEGVARLYLWRFKDLEHGPPPVVSLGSGFDSLGTGDFDADGCPDLVASGSGGAVIGRGDCLGGFLPGPLAAAPLFAPLRAGAPMSREGPGQISILDYDRNGTLDLVTTALGDGALHLLRGDGAGGFLPDLDLGGVQGARLNVADLNRDGLPDVVTDNGALSVYLGQPDGTLAWVSTPASQDAAGAAIGDLNGDGVLDLMAGGDERFGDAPTIKSYVGNGDGTYGTPEDTCGSVNFVQELAAVDLNRDGTLDLVAAVRGQTGTGDRAGVRWCTRYPARTTSRPAYGSPGANGLNVADLDDDGRPDFVTVGENSSDVSVFWSYPDGQTPTSTQLSVGDAPRDVAVADFNRDGRKDLAVLLGDRSSVRIILAR